MSKLILFIGSLVVLAISCASPSSPVAPAGSQAGVNPDVKQTQQVAREDWQVKWDKVLQGAKKEGKVVIYGPAGGEIRMALVKAMNDKYGITVDYLGATGPEVAAKILSERRGGLRIPDVLIGASSPVITSLKPSGHLDRLEPVLILPEVTDPRVWWENKLPWVDKERYMLAFGAKVTPPFAINKEIVKPDEVKSLRNLLEPKWKGKMVMHDPTIYGSGQFFVAPQAEMMGIDFLRQLAAQEPVILRDKRLLADWIAKGRYPIGIAAAREVEELIDAGAPLQWVLTNEQTHVTGGAAFLSLPNEAPHPNASSLFINWLLTREGQDVYSKATKQQSAREDLTYPYLDPQTIRKPGVKYFRTDTEEFLLKGAEQLKLGRDIFGHLIK